MCITNTVKIFAQDTSGHTSSDDTTISVNLSDLKINMEDKQDWDGGLIQAIQKEEYGNNKKTGRSVGINIENIISDYCENHYDNISGAIYEEALSKVGKEDNIKVDLDENSDIYKKYTNQYQIDDNTRITITPESIIVDEYNEQGVESENNIQENLRAANKWKYKNVATRRTLYYKVTVSGKTHAFKIYSVHTGGQVKYDGSKAKHSAEYYAYSIAEAYGSPFSFKTIAKQSEEYNGTSWHYKYLGKVTESISITVPIKVKIQFKEKALGCQVITDKKGNVTKKYWPSL